MKPTTINYPYILLWWLLLAPHVGFSQPVYTSLAHQQSVWYNSLGLHTEAQFDSLHQALNPHLPTYEPPAADRQNCTLNSEVYGFQPYWVGASQYNQYDYHLLSTLAYFSYELDPSTGSYTDIHAWRTTNVINLARAAGCKIDLTVTNFGSAANTTFLTNTTAWDTFADSIIALLNVRQANGINIDFEGASGGQDDNFVDFITYLDNRLATDRPATTISLCLYAVDWGGFFNITDLVPHIDRFIIMGYDYHYSGDAQAGPCAPLYNGSIWNMYTFNRSINYYLTQGVPNQKLIAAVPYYGYDWTTENTNIPAATTANANSRTYSYVRSNFYDTYTRQWDEHSLTPYFMYLSGGEVRQCWYDDEQSLGYRYNLIRNKQLAGTGMWALGYDAGYGQLWQLLADNFTDCHDPCTGNTAYDSGGELGSYQNNENYTLTFSSAYAAVPVTLVFDSFDIENGFDKVRIYDGSNTAAPLLGEYTGTNSPGIVSSTGAALTIQFTSDNATTRPGFALHWQCGSCFPSTQVEPLQAYYNNDFAAVFADNDACGLGLNGRFYQVSTQTEPNDWRSNGKAGFFNDDFDSGILSSDWGAAVGTWIANEGAVRQINTAEDNTNLYTEVSQTNDGTYLYHFAMQITGDGTNRRAGLHFFASDDDAENRGNSYFVFLRADGNKAQIYKVTDNVFTLVQDNTLTTNPHQWYDYKVTYSPSSGEIRLYRDHLQVANWTDSNPITSGNFVSLRTGGCQALYNFVRVLRSRNNAASISVGASPTDAVQYNGMGALPVQIASVIRDAGNRWTATATAYTTIDVFLSADATTANASNASAPMQLYPNPATNQLYLQLHSPVPTTAQVWVCDVLGRKVFEQHDVAIHAGKQLLPIAVQQWAAGEYVVVVQTEQQQYQQLLIISK